MLAIRPARDPRADARRALPQARTIVEGDVSTIAGSRLVAEQANKLGRFDAVIHNVGVGYREPRRIETEDGLSHVFAINVLAPYLLTALMHKPKRLVYLSSGMHHGVDAHLDNMQWNNRRWNGSQTYAESKLHDVLLAFAVARRWPGVLSNSLEPGWVPTRMGGLGAPDDLEQAHETQAWLAAGKDADALVTGKYFYHLRRRAPNPQTQDVALQGRLLDMCEQLSRIPLPA